MSFMNLTNVSNVLNYGGCFVLAQMRHIYYQQLDEYLFAYFLSICE